MSIGIAYTLEDRVLLITDTRQIEGFYTDNEIIIDDADKIYEISYQIAAVGVGIEQGTEIAVNTLKASVNENSSLERISNALFASIEVGWKGLKQKVLSDVDINAPYFKLGLLIGGVAENQLFTMGMIRSHNFKTPVVKKVGNYEAIMIGIESLDISDRFGIKADEIITHHKHSQDKDNNELLTKKILSLAEDTIKEIAHENNMISDKIIHTIIWK